MRSFRLPTVLFLSAFRFPFILASSSINPLTGLVPREEGNNRDVLPDLYERDHNDYHNELSPPTRKSNKHDRMKPKHRHIGGSVPPKVYKGTIEVTDINTHKHIGYVSKISNEFGEYSVTTNHSQYLQIEFTIPFSLHPVHPHVELDIKTMNEISSFPYFGGVVGFSSTSSDLSRGSFNYAVIAGSSMTSPGSKAVTVPNAFETFTMIPTKCESAIWSIDTSTWTIVPIWVNSHGSNPKVYLTYSQDVLLFTGDFNAFKKEFGTSTEVSFSFVGL